MIIRIEAEDGQDFIVRCDEGSGGIGIGVGSEDEDGRKAQVEHFTIEEAKAAITALEFAIKIAEAERDQMEARNGN